VQQAGGRHHPETGHYAPLTISGCKDIHEAREYVRALHRSGRYLTRWKVADIGVAAKVVKGQGTKYDIQFTAIDKSLARKHVLEKYGPDKAKWPYDPTKRGGPK
jgi:hypothetical protein